MGRKILLVLCSLSIGIAVASVLVWNALHAPLSITDQEAIYQIRKGASITQVASDLQNKQVISDRRLLSFYARLLGKTNIKVGEYRLSSDLTVVSLLDQFVKGNVITYSVTLVEGWTFQQALDFLQAQPKLATTLNSEADKISFFAELKIPNNHPEGWFFPDTYSYALGDNERSILEQAHTRMRDVLQTEWAARAERLPYQTPYEALIMASIVEKETGAAYEREQIAGVFVRRLQKRMRLETDPTVIYGLGDSYTGNLRRHHLRLATPYNTYMNFGLPPTPIALPGQEAIYAALHPDTGDSLFFVAKGDGSHQFSATYEEHKEAVQHYQVRNRPSNYQSAPRR